MTKIAIGMATNGTVKSRTMFCVAETLRTLKHETYLIVKSSCMVHINREDIAKEAIKQNCSHVLFIDADMYFHPEVVDILLKRDKDIIGVATNYRSLPLTTTVKVADTEGNLVGKEYPDKLFTCYAVGTGFMLIKTSVFKKIPHPWFFLESDEEGNMKTGEDVWFCKKAREMGYEIWCDPTVVVKHIGDYLY